MDDLRVLCFGDSFTAGVGDPRGLGWVGRVAAAAHDAGRPLTAYALGVRRETSVQVAVRWRFEAEPRLARDADCRVVFCVGANDVTAEGDGVRVTPDRSCMALAKMLDQAAAMRLPAAVVGPPPADPAASERVLELTAAFAQLCGERGVPFWPVAEALLACAPWREEAAAGDGAHPGAGGYDALARLLLDGGLLAWLCAPAVTPL